MTLTQDRLTTLYLSGNIPHLPERPKELEAGQIWLEVIDSTMLRARLWLIKDAITMKVIGYYGHPYDEQLSIGYSTSWLYRLYTPSYSWVCLSLAMGDKAETGDTWVNRSDTPASVYIVDESFASRELKPQNFPHWHCIKKNRKEVTMTPEQRITELENLLAKQKEELEKLKQEIKTKELDLSPYSGEGYYYDTTGKITFSANSKGRTIEDYARFPTPEQAEWQAKSDRARRKLNHLMLRLNPKGWKPPSTGWYNIVIGVEVQAVGFFYSEEARDIAIRELQDELPYFNWFNSPQAKGE